MKSCKEMRAEALGICKGKWYWRLATAIGVLYAIMLTAIGVMKSLYHNMGIQTWTDFLSAKLQAAQQGLGYSVPSVRAAFDLAGASAFETFITYVFSAILAVGIASVALKAIRNDETNWFSGALGGFKRPLGMTWLLIVMNLRIFLWSLLFLIPGIVAIYRYRQAWFIKAEQPEKSAGECLTESGRLMRGYKWKAMVFDFSYIWWYLLLWGVLFIIITAIVLAKSSLPFLEAPIVAIGTLGTLYYLVFLIGFVVTGRAVFYRELTSGQSAL